MVCETARTAQLYAYSFRTHCVRSCVQVNEAIEYFPGRVRRDEWQRQAKGRCK